MQRFLLCLAALVATADALSATHRLPRHQLAQPLRNRHAPAATGPMPVVVQPRAPPPQMQELPFWENSARFAALFF